MDTWFMGMVHGHGSSSWFMDTWFMVIVHGHMVHGHMVHGHNYATAYGKNI